MQKMIVALLWVIPIFASAQSYTDSLLNSRQRYKEGLLIDNHPLKPEDTAYLRFYDPDPEYCVNSVFVPVNGTRPFLMDNMHGGTRKGVKEYGYVYFNLRGGTFTLRIYQFLDNGGLFIPFTDRTNYKETFQGGRYLDVAEDDIINSRLILDFNKCYNPHTAYQKGYPYLIPPRVNSLKIEIKAGEKIFGHNPGY